MKFKTGIGEGGNRIGQGHVLARFTDHERELVLMLRDEGWSVRRIARKMEMSRNNVQHILSGLHSQPREFREVTVDGRPGKCRKPDPV